ncbi:AMP-binding protein [Acetobacter senegalensis]|uniref:AMP-binding protein n=1 Tax=Acetobacter senegalensis TaxID=446692 RepID=UPI000777F626|nr:AMP-binding protein [Acetobacter senegalensis]
MDREFNVVLGPGGQNIVDWQKGSLAELACFRAATNPNLEILTFLGDGCNETAHLTAQELDTKAGNLASWLIKFLRPQQRVVLLFENSPEYLLGLFGCAYAGVTPVSGVYPTDFGSKQRFCHIVKDSNAVAVIGEKKTLASFQKECQLENLNILWIPVELSEKHNKYSYFPVKNSDEALIQYTSGSTNIPKGVILTSRNILFNLTQQGIKLGYTQGDVGVSWLPLSHDMGLMGAALMAIAAGGQCVLLPPEKFLQTPTNWLRAISKYKATLSGAPGFAYDMCVNFEDNLLESVDLSKWEQAFVGSESISFETIQKFSSKFSKYGFKDNAFCPCYGLAEATLLVSCKARKQNVSLAKFSRAFLTESVVAPPLSIGDERILVSCGEVIDETHVLIITNETDFSLAAENEEGLLYVSGPGVSEGYCGYGNQNIMKLQHNELNYLYTGDKGFFSDKTLFLTGRKNNEVIINGFKIDPEDFVFSVAQKITGISQNNCTVFLRNNIPTFVCSIFNYNNGEEKLLSYQVQKIFEEKFKIKEAEIWFVNQASFSKTPSGKINIESTKHNLFHNESLILKKIKIEKKQNFIVFNKEIYLA